jgi:lipopolysaccharide biosynthesis glycosyltransferase
MRRNLLVTLADRNFLDQAKQLFSSVYWNAGWEGEYMLLACDIPEPELKWFREKGILVKEVKPFANKDLGEQQSRYPATVTCKFALFSEEFKGWRTVVFIDADCIVRYPLDSLAKTKCFAAVRDWLMFAIIQLQTKKTEGMDESEYYRRFEGYNLMATAFNSGVFAFNTEIINNTTQAELRQIIEKYGKLARYPDQLWLNLYFYKRWERLPMEYNLFASFLHARRGLPKSQVDAVIMHFPRWPPDESIRCWHHNNAFYDEWKRNLERAELIDLKQVPTAKSKWPGLRQPLFQRWRLRLALRRDYVNFYRNKIALRSRIRRVISGTF